MTRKDLEDLGFEKVVITDLELMQTGNFEEAAEDGGYYFYSLPIVEEEGEFNLELTSNANDAFDLSDEDGDGWYVEFFDNEYIRFYKKDELEQLIELLFKNKKK
tara:strand:- start:43 stop:354 length:312 start_codon:yes stop_codon:yes gene_type:complete